MTNLFYLDVDLRPFKTLVLSEQLAATRLAWEVPIMRGLGVSVYTYPAVASLTSEKRTDPGAFEFTVSGPPGAYTILRSADLAAWSELDTLTNELGTAVFTDFTLKDSSQNFYRARTAR